MNDIVRARLTNFVSKLGIDDSLEESKKFEHFATFSVLSSIVNDNLSKTDLESISMEQAQGVDTIAFVINGLLIANSEDKDLFDGQNLIIDIFFLQSKTARSFDGGAFTSFLDVVIDFFEDKPKYHIPDFANAKDIYKDIIIDGIEKGRNMTVNLHCLYVILCPDQSHTSPLKATISIKKEILTKKSLFDDIVIDVIDEAKILELHRKVITPLKATFFFAQKTLLPEINDVDEAYIGFVPFSEFRKLIMDEDQTKLKSLFNDNLREFLGLDNNPVNQGIKRTLEEGKFVEFSLLNNGITIIADSNTGKGNTMTINNYQIVNGCQTSNILFECRNISEIDSVLIPLKVIITQNERIRSEIVLTTNSQSNFSDAQLFGITQFQKTLEDYYDSKKHEDNLFYERRTNQYANLNLNGNVIIDIKEQLKSFLAMFFDLPHLVSGNIGKVVKTHKDKFFQEKHDPLPYYIAGLLSKKWDTLRTDERYKTFNKYRYHIFMGFRILVEELPFAPEYITKVQKYAIKVPGGRKSSYDKLLSVIRNTQELKQYLNVAILIFETIPDYDLPRKAYSSPITEKFKELLQGHLDSADSTIDIEENNTKIAT